MHPENPATSEKPATPENTDALDAPDTPGPLRVRTDEQLRALASHTRHRILRVLRDGPATITQIAERLGIAKGSSNHHVKILARAGIVHVVERRKTGGVTEQYYARTGTGIRLPDHDSGQQTLMRHALADIEAAPPHDQRTVVLKHARLSAEAWAEFDERLLQLLEEFSGRSDPTQPAAGLFVALYRPEDV